MAVSVMGPKTGLCLPVSLLTLGALLIAGHIITMPAAAGQSVQEGRTAGDPYCVPEVWQGGRAVTLGQVDSAGKFTVKQSLGSVIYSAKRQKMAVVDGLYYGTYVRYIFDYPAKVLYTVTGTSNFTCQKTSLPGPFKPQCVPGNASVTQGESTYGTGQNTVKSIELEGTQNGVNYSVSLTPDTFLPIFETLRATKPNGGHPLLRGCQRGHVTFDFLPCDDSASDSGLLGVLSSLGLPIPGWLNVAVAVLVLPINSAVNPFLYTYNLLMERRRKVSRAAKQRLMDQILKSFQEQGQEGKATCPQDEERPGQNPG